MKRPLCLLAILLTAAVFIYLELHLSDITGKVPEGPDGSSVTVTGMVQGKEYRKSFSGEILPVIYLLPNDQDITEYCLIQCYLDSEDNLPALGEYVKVSGRVKVFSSPTNPGEFDSRLYYSSLKITYRLTGACVLARGGHADKYREMLFRIRMFFESALDRGLSQEDASIMKAMLLGDKAYMDSDIKDMYKDSGIIHILAVSGLHISIIGMGVYELLRRFSLWGVTRLEELAWGNCEGKKQAAIRRRKIAHARQDACIFVRLFEHASLYKVTSAMTRIAPVMVAICFMYSYGVMCGMGTSSFRAICMFALRLVAPLLGRTYDILSALALAEILLLLDQPLYLYNSGFLFSFGALLGITVVRPLLVPARKLLGLEDEKMKFVDEKESGSGTFTGVADVLRKALDGLVSGVAVAITTLPVYACFYYTYPLHSLVLNLVVIPVMGVLMLAGIVCMLLGAGTMLIVGMASMDSALALILRIPGIVVHGILAIYRWLCSGSSVRSIFTWYMGHSEKWQVVAYVSMVVTFVGVSMGVKPMLKYKRLRASRELRIMLDGFRFALLLAAALLLTFHVQPDLEIDMIDVGQGDGIVISSSGHHILIDGGSSSKKNVGKYQIIPFLKYQGIGGLDAAVVTHEDQDHISGILEIMDDMEKGGIRIGELMLPEVAESSRGENYHKLEERAAELKIPIGYINAGESFGLGKAKFTCLNPQLGMATDGANAYSTVLFMEYEGIGRLGDENDSDRVFTALFTGDVEGEGQEYLKSVIKNNPEDYRNLTLLKVAHHGSQYTTDDEFLSLTHPKLAFISCGRDNSYRHPHQELLERLEDVHAKIYRTDQSGFISVTVQGEPVALREYLK